VGKERRKERERRSLTNSNNNNNNELVISAAATAFRNFVKACKTPDTRTVYTMGLHYYMDYLGVPREQYDKLLPPEKDSRTIQMDIRGYATYLSQEQKRSYATISTYVAAISKFYAFFYDLIFPSLQEGKQNSQK